MTNHSTKDFYENEGWREVGEGLYEDTRRWEDLRPCAASYVRACTRRILDHIPAAGQVLLDVGSGPVVHDEYLELSRRFVKHYCVDLSERALAAARARVGDRGVYVHGDFCAVELPDDYFDCVVCLHMLYHVRADLQEAFVRRMLHLAKPGAPVVVAYANPRDVTHLFPLLRRTLDAARPQYNSYPYYFIHPIAWWQRFADQAEVDLHPMRALNVEDARALVPDNPEGTLVFEAIRQLEETHPMLLARWGHYYIVVLRRAMGAGAGVASAGQRDDSLG